ncbi:glycosyltransferase involved in cell wall biosynthesis [Flavobacterium sp. 103]|uniref:glycosyltransferase n=1 Tax=Flavobacterium sp. 103 TaxID=2135624 RepID=UPI000D5CE537|nr:glycosyltransferase [Flavobacterium sp. 103]PVX46594.1 glycosyltransferase involved in cell wall biosynthesis [Flavobacterium sp. 103]
MENKIKVLYIVSTLKRTGPINIMSNLISELDKSKFEPLVLTLSKEDDRFPSLCDSLGNMGVKILSLSLSRAKGFFFGRKKIKEIIFQENIGVVHLFGFRPDLLVNSRKFSNVKIVSAVNSNVFDDYTMLYGNFVGRLMAFLHMKSLNGKIGVACSKFVAEEINERYGVKLKVVYNGIPKEDYTCTTNRERNEIRIKLGLPVDKQIFIFVGYLIYRKDPITVIKAFLNSTVVDNSILLMIGDGPLMDECKSICENKTEVIRFLGNQPSTLSFLKASNFYISSAYSEGLPTSVMEAMGCGLPVILSSIKPHEELVSYIENWNYLFPVSNSDILSSKFEKVIEDDYQKLSDSCRYVVSDIINSNIMARNYQLLYQI